MSDDANQKRREAARRRYAEDPEKYRAINRAKYAADPEMRKRASLRWKEANCEELQAKRKIQYLRRKREEREISAFVGARNRAQQKGMAFDLTKEWVKARAEKCELSGLPFMPEYDGVHGRNPFAPSIDRIDSSKGYTQGNCRVILYCLNMGLGQWGLDEVAPIWAAVLEKLAKPDAPV